MSNPYYTRTFNAIDGTFARAAGVRNEYARVEQGFDLLDVRLAGALPQWLPVSLVGHSLKYLRVNAAENAIEFARSGFLNLIDVLASRDIADSDIGGELLCDSASPIVLTIEAFATVPIEPGAAFVALQRGAGTVTIAAGAGVTLRSADNLLSTRARYSQITAVQIATNEWVIGGDRGA